MFVMDKVVALIALAVAKKASAYAVVRVSDGYNICILHILNSFDIVLYLLVKMAT